MKSLTSFIVAVLLALFFVASQDGTAQSSRKGFLGVTSEKVTRKIISKYDLPVDYGAYITSVVDGSAAEEAGIQPKDVIVELGDEKIYDDDDLTSAIRGTKPYTEVKIELYRKGEKKILTAKIDKLKTYSEDSFTLDWLSDLFGSRHHKSLPRGVKAEDMTRQLGEYFGAPDGRGVLITEVHKGGVVDKAGFHTGDVVTKVADRSTDDLGDLLDAIDNHEGKEVSVEVVRDRKPMTLSMKIPGEDDDWY